MLYHALGERWQGGGGDGLIRAIKCVLRAIYTVRFCRMRYAYAMPTTRIVSCKLNLQHPYDSRPQHEKCRRILKHVLKPYDSRSHRSKMLE